MAIQVEDYKVQFTVATRHGSSLEAVLRDAAERQDLDPSHYIDELSDALDLRFKDHDGMWMHDSTYYGDLFFTVGADDAMLLQDALAACEEVVIAWAKKFNVERMKPR